ncbi:MAG: hypothetical protein ACLVKR_00845 [Lachnospiraceae bacterium]
MIIGAGTVLDGETARQAILAGANFVVSLFKYRHGKDPQDIRLRSWPAQ